MDIFFQSGVLLLTRALAAETTFHTACLLCTPAESPCPCPCLRRQAAPSQQSPLPWPAALQCECWRIQEKAPITAPLKHELQQLLLFKVSVTPVIYSSQDVFIHPLFICICFTTIITIS